MKNILVTLFVTASFLGCTHTSVVVVTTVVKKNSPTDKSEDYYYAGPYTNEVKKLLNKALGGDESAEKPDGYKD